MSFRRSASWDGGDSFRFAGRTHPNHNKLLETYAGADGIKTGYIRASGFKPGQ